MKQMYPGYYRPTEDEFAELWKTCLFVLDANVLLNLYRYSTTTSQELLAILKQVADRLWIPYRVGLEYQRERIGVIEQQANAYKAVSEFLDAAEKRLDNELRSFSRHPFMQIRPMQQQITRVFTRIRKDLEKMRKGHPNLLDKDYIREEITSLFEGKVGSPYPRHRLEEIYKEGAKRYEERMPPGYEDRQKGDRRQYGDLVLWFEIIDKAKEAKTPIILVTDDRKEDWWLNSSAGKTISPRLELIEEMTREAGVRFYMYQADPFMEYARGHITKQVRQEAIDEVRAVRERDEELASAAQASGLRLSTEELRALASPTPGIDALLRNMAQSPLGFNFASGEALGRLGAGIPGMNFASDEALRRVSASIAGMNFGAEGALRRVSANIAAMNFGADDALGRLSANIAGMNFGADDALRRLSASIPGMNFGADDALRRLSASIPGMNFSGNEVLRQLSKVESQENQGDKSTEEESSKSSSETTESSEDPGVPPNSKAGS